MDRLRGLAVILVIIWHAVSIPTFFGMAMPGVVQWLNDALSPYRIPALLVLSGMLLERSMRKPTGRYFWGKFANIGWPYLVWSCIYLLANPGADGTSPAFWLGGSYLWYLLVVGLCYAIAPVTRWVPAIAVAALLIVVAIGAPQRLDDLAPVLSHLPFFFIGAAAVPLFRRALDLPGWVVLVAGVVAGAWGAYSATQIGYAQRLHPIGTPLSLIGVVCLAWLVNRPSRMRALEWAGRHSLELYVAHFPVMVLIMRFGGTELGRIWAYATLFAVGIGASALLATFLSRTPLFQLPTERTLTVPRGSRAS